MTKFVKSIALAAVLVGASTGVSAANLVTNGGFEAGLGAGNGWTVTNLTGTTPGQGVTAITTNGVTDSTGYGDYVLSYDGGSKAAYFVDDRAIQSLSQYVSLTGGQTYTLSFALFATQSGSANEHGFVLAETVGLFTFANLDLSSQIPVGVWTDYSYTFTAPVSMNYNLRFSFASGGTPAKDVLLDGVSITAVPEPSTWAMMIGGLGLVGVAMRRRKTTVSFA